MKKIIVFVSFLVISVAGLCAQSSEKVSKILKSERITFGEAAYFCGTALGYVGESASDEESFAALSERGFFKKTAKADDRIKMKEYADLCCRTWVVEGSIMMKLVPGPRYALKKMKADSVIAGSADPDAKVSGHEALNIISDCIARYALREAPKAAGNAEGMKSFHR